jgi:hypothetical protein
VCAGAVVGIDRNFTFFSHFDGGVNIGDTQMNKDVCCTAVHLAIGESVGVDGDLVGAIPDAVEKKGALLVGGCLLRRGRLQTDVSSDDCGSSRIEYGAAKISGLGPAGLCVQFSADAQRCAEEDASPSIHRSASTYKLRIAVGAKAKQCRLSS